MNLALYLDPDPESVMDASYMCFMQYKYQYATPLLDVLDILS